MARHMMFFVLNILIFMVVPSHSRKFRFAVAFNGLNTDFGWTYNNNLARIGLQEHLKQNHPELEVDNIFDIVPESWSAQCDPKFVEWCTSGVNIIFGSGMGHQFCVANLAASYPNITFFGLSGAAKGPSNYANLNGRSYQNTYLAGYMAGLMTSAKKVCVSTTNLAVAVLQALGAFVVGVQKADPSVEIHIMSTGVLRYPLLEVWIVNQSYAMGCDVVWVQSLGSEGIQQAQNLGLMAIGFFSDGRLIVGEYVITSALTNFTPYYIRGAEAMLKGTLQNDTQKSSWWMGWEWGGLQLAKPSFLVPDNITAKVEAQKNNLTQIFCGRYCSKTKCLCNSSSCCLTDAQLVSLDFIPDIAIFHGTMQLPGVACSPGQLATWHLDTFTMQCTSCPAGTYAYNYNQISECRFCPIATFSRSGSTNCSACPAGTYANQPGSAQCTPCPAGSIATNPGSSICNRCPSGLSNSDGAECMEASLLWLAGLGGGIGALFLLIGSWGWWATRKMRKLRSQFSNDNVAVECAAAIACLDLQAVAWLNDIPKPNCIQLSFIRIVKILEEVRKYVPDQLLQSLANGGQERNEEGDTKSVAESSHSIGPRSPSVVSMPNQILPVASSPHHRHGSKQSLCSQEGPSLFVIKKVTYMQVLFNMNQHISHATHAEGNMKAFLSFMIETVKANGGTVGNVLYDHAIIHWGTGKRTIAEAPTKAVETALALANFNTTLYGGAELELSIIIGCGNCFSGIVETATNRFFVVGGGQVPLVQRVASNDWKSSLGTQVLITDCVRSSVQYSFLCHPRLADGQDILWEPVSHNKEKAEDEWMYQLQEGEEATLTPGLLRGPFVALCKEEFEKAESLIKDIYKNHSKGLTRNDTLALKFLGGAIRNRTNRCISTGVGW
eukprot:GGOE01030045.1.p1 GENE.GGOE01030045.1~~GGOE01030045.1.p1  ORF type:complete len:899 (-),score=205.65 GGOE01030045.1:245-2920(-)